VNKTFGIATETQNLQKFSPANETHYMVLREPELDYWNMNADKLSFSV